MQDEVAQHVAPDVIGAAALADGLAAQDDESLGKRAGAHLVEEPRFADAAFAGDQPGSATTGVGRGQGGKQRRELGMASDERRRLQQAFARRRRLARQRQIESAGEIGDRRLGAGRSSLGTFIEQAGEERSQTRLDDIAVPGQLGAQNVLAQGLSVRRVERKGTDQELVGDQAEGVQIAACRRPAAENDFRRDVRQRAARVFVV